MFLSVDKVDFSSGLQSELVKEYLNTTDKKKVEIFSRDFTINSLHLDYIREKFIDYTGRSFNDINNRIIIPNTTAEICLSDNPSRILRAISLATRLNFEIDKSIIDYTRNNITKISSHILKDKKYFTSSISRSINNDEERTINLLNETGLFKYVPLVGKFKETLIKNKLLSNYLVSSESEDVLSYENNTIDQFLDRQITLIFIHKIYHKTAFLDMGILLL